MAISRIQLNEISYVVRASSQDKLLLRNATAEFKKGTVTLVTGPTGAGKSTLMFIIAGILRPTMGELLSDAEPVSKWQASHRDLWRRQVGIAFQGGLLLEDLTAAQNIAVPLIPRGIALREQQRATDQMIELLALQSIAQQVANELSFGERQRINIARALVHRPDLVLLDEPTAHQDEDGLGLIVDAIGAVCQQSIVVVTSHDPRVIDQPIADHRLTLAEGILQEAS